MRLTAELLNQVTKCGNDKAKEIVELLNYSMNLYDISTPLEIGSFLANLAHESNKFKSTRENLNYSVKGLVATWPSRFKNRNTGKASSKARRLGRTATQRANQSGIANYVYASRMGNGNEISGDGWKYRGGGWIMATGREMYQKITDEFGIDFVSHPDLITEPLYSALTSAFIWHMKGLDRYDDDYSVKEETRIINGWYLGLADRQRYMDAYVTIMKAKGYV